MQDPELGVLEHTSDLSLWEVGAGGHKIKTGNLGTKRHFHSTFKVETRQKAKTGGSRHLPFPLGRPPTPPLRGNCLWPLSTVMIQTDLSKGQESKPRHKLGLLMSWVLVREKGQTHGQASQ